MNPRIVLDTQVSNSLKRNFIFYEYLTKNNFSAIIIIIIINTCLTTFYAGPVLFYILAHVNQLR